MDAAACLSRDGLGPDMNRAPDLACWHYGLGAREALPAAGGDVLRCWLEDALRRCEAAVGDFGAVSTRREGGLSLHLHGADGSLLEDAAELRVTAWRRDDGSLDLRRVYPVELTFALHVDAAVPRDAMGRANAARLAAFLGRLEDAGPCELFGIVAPGYERTACARGFQEEDSIGRAC